MWSQLRADWTILLSPSSPKQSVFRSGVEDLSWQNRSIGQMQHQCDTTERSRFSSSKGEVADLLDKAVPACFAQQADTLSAVLRSTERTVAAAAAAQCELSGLATASRQILAVSVCSPVQRVVVAATYADLPIVRRAILLSVCVVDNWGEAELAAHALGNFGHEQRQNRMFRNCFRRCDSWVDGLPLASAAVLDMFSIATQSDRLR